MAKTMNRAILLVTLLIAPTKLIFFAASDDTYPTVPGTNAAECSVYDTITNKNTLTPVRRDVYGGGRIIDITHRITSDFPDYFGMGRMLRLVNSMKNGSAINLSELKLIVHTGTHVDAPGHMFDHYFDAGFDVDSLDLDVLNGTVLHSTLLLLPHISHYCAINSFGCYNLPQIPAFSPMPLNMLSPF